MGLTERRKIKELQDTTLPGRVKEIEEICGKPIPYQIVDRRPGDIAKCYADPTKAREELGWTAQRDIAQMCADRMNVLVHCNLGESRGPSIALLYMAARLHALPTTSLEAAEEKFTLIPEMHVKGRSAHVRPVQNLLYRNRLVFLLKNE